MAAGQARKTRWHQNVVPRFIVDHSAEPADGSVAELLARLLIGIDRNRRARLAREAAESPAATTGPGPTRALARVAR